AVAGVFAQPLTRRVAESPGFLSERVDVHGEAICVLDLARRLAVAHSHPVEERRLVLVRDGDVALALCVDKVHDPEEVARGEPTENDRVNALERGLPRDGVRAVAQAARGPLLVISPHTLVSPEIWKRLPELARLGNEPAPR